MRHHAGGIDAGARACGLTFSDPQMGEWSGPSRDVPSRCRIADRGIRFVTAPARLALRWHRAALGVGATRSGIAVGIDAEALAGIGPLMQAYVDDLGFAGIVVAVAQHGEVLFAGEYG